MKLFQITLIIMLVMLSACANNAPEPNLPDTEQEQANTQEPDEPGTDDAGRENDDLDEALKETDDAVENAGEVIEDTVSDDTVFCEAGGVYKYGSDGGDVDAIIIGLETYKGKKFCRAESTTTIDSPAGEIDTDTTYYYNVDASEMWVIATTSSEFMPQPQINEVHVVDGKVVS